MLIARALQGRRDQVRLSVKFGALRTPDSRWVASTTVPRRRIPRVHSAAPRHRSRRHLPPIPLRSSRAHRRHRRCHCRSDQGRLGASSRSLRSRSRHYPPRPRSSSHWSIYRLNIRSSAAVRKPPSSPLCATWESPSRPTASLPRSAQWLASHRIQGLPQPPAALSRPPICSRTRAHRHAANSCRGEKSTPVQLAIAWVMALERHHRARDRRAPAYTIRGCPRQSVAFSFPSRPGAHVSRHPSRRSSRNPLR